MRALVIRTLTAKMDAGTITESERFALKAARALDAARAGVRADEVVVAVPALLPGVIDLAAFRARRQGQ